MKQWETKRVKIADLKPAAYNPREITDRALAGLEQSINRFGLVQPIVWNKKTGNIVGGHQRLKVLLNQGIDEVDVVEVDLEEKDEIALNVALNNPAIQGEFDDRIGDLLKGIRQENQDLFEKLRMDDLAETLRVTFGDQGNDPDDVPTPPTKDFDSKEGVIYCLGKHRLLCGDSTVSSNVQKLCGEVKMDMLLTDPPYNVGYVGKTEDALTIANDKMTEESFTAFLVNAFRAADTVMRPAAVFYIWHACSKSYEFLTACRKTGWNMRQILIWAKNSMVMGRCDYHFRHEPVIYGWKDGGSHTWNSDRKQTTVLEFDRPSASTIHPTMKSVALFEYLVLNNTLTGENILDTFGGSGTTIIAAEKTGRISYMMELDPAYCDAIRQRWAEFVHGKGCDWKTLTKAE